MIAEAKRQPGAEAVRWLVARAQDVSSELGKFRVVSCGSSFHWMDRGPVLKKIATLLDPGGGIALVGGTSGWWDGAEDWQQVVTGVVRHYLGEIRRAGRSGYAASVSEERFEQTLERNGWRVTFERDYPVRTRMGRRRHCGSPLVDVVRGTGSLRRPGGRLRARAARGVGGAAAGWALSGDRRFWVGVRAATIETARLKSGPQERTEIFDTFGRCGYALTLRYSAPYDEDRDLPRPRSHHPRQRNRP